VSSVLTKTARWHTAFSVLLILLWLWLLLDATQACAYDVLCRNGNTAFEGYFRTGVQVDVGPPTRAALAVRTCRAVLSWGDEELVVAKDAAEIDLDIFGVDPGVGHPVAAFQIKRAEADCCMEYKIYSLDNPPLLLRTLSGGGYFNAADTNLNGQVEIWTDDVAAVEGFEGFRASQFDFPPHYVLRFEEGKLLDVSTEFQSYFDDQIEKLRAQINPGELQRFKLSDGKLTMTGASARVAGAVPKPLLTVKRQILQLVWAYLYSNREKQAWRTLVQMWSPADVPRIRLALLAMRARGIRAQLDGTSGALPPTEIEHSKVYDSTKEPAQPIMVRFYPSAANGSLRGKFRVDLVVDSTGKVWSVTVRGKNKAAYDAVKHSTTNWKFIPAFIDNTPVASRLKITISLKQ
jgi:hypothetical protein